MTNRYQLNQERDSIKNLFSQYPLEVILCSIPNKEVTLTAYEKACATILAIEFCHPGSYEDKVINLPPQTVLDLGKRATIFCVNYPEKRTNLSDINSVLYTTFSNMANQFSLTMHDSADFARTWLIYVHILQDKAPHYLEEFYKIKKYTIKDYIKVCFLAYAGLKKNSNMLTDEYIENGVISLNISSFDTAKLILNDISKPYNHFNKKRKTLNQNDTPYKYNPLVRYPLIKPWIHNPSSSKNNRYIAPLPDLILQKVHMGIYHELHTAFGLNFLNDFGKNAFEHYVHNTLLNSIGGERLIDEKQLLKECSIPKKISVPDFLIVCGFTGVIFECKSAILPQQVFINGEMNDFKSSLKKICRGVSQIESFEKYALDHNIYGVDRWYRVLVTYQNLWGANSDLIFDKVTDDIIPDKISYSKLQAAFQKTNILSISELDNIQLHISKKDSFIDILSQIQEEYYQKVIKSLQCKTGNKFRHSHLSRYLDEIQDEITAQ